MPPMSLTYGRLSSSRRRCCPWTNSRPRPRHPRPTVRLPRRESVAARSGHPCPPTYPHRVQLRLRVDGRDVELDDDGGSLLEVLRDRLGRRGAKDGCSPQGQCGCCTVLIDGQPRVACVTPARRVAGREVTTIEGLDPAVRRCWSEAFSATGASQCGFCTPGIIVRLASLAARTGQRPLSPPAVEDALVAHLCRCTGWRTIVDAAVYATSGGDHGDAPVRDLDAAARRASLEGRAGQRVGPSVALGEGGFADDTAPSGALVAIPDGAGGWAVAETL